jgi:hypothetical protein
MSLKSAIMFYICRIHVCLNGEKADITCREMKERVKILLNLICKRYKCKYYLKRNLFRSSRCMWSDSLKVISQSGEYTDYDTICQGM